MVRNGNLVKPSIVKNPLISDGAYPTLISPLKAIVNGFLVKTKVLILLSIA